MRGKSISPKTYTFRAQDVYVSRSKRIRFRRKTYTFYSRYVYVSLGKAIRLALSPSKLPFSTERCTSPQEITFAPSPRTFRGTYPHPSCSHKKQYPKRRRRFGYIISLTFEEMCKKFRRYFTSKLDSLLISHYRRPIAGRINFFQAEDW